MNPYEKIYDKIFRLTAEIKYSLTPLATRKLRKLATVRDSEEL
jgi:hypothetical protein